jgi:hypothetical protein
MPLPRTVCPGAQQRRLPAADRSRDDRHLLGRRAIQGCEKITPVDQPESCPSHQGQRTYCQRPRGNSVLLRSHSRAVGAIPSRPLSYLMMRPPSAHSTWPVIAAAMSEAK